MQETFNHCSRCRVVVYCSKACQKQHWTGGHKDTCKPPSLAKKPTTDEEQSKPPVPGKSRPPKGVAAAEEEKQEQKQKPSRRYNAQVDATGGPLSFSRDDMPDCAICLDSPQNPIHLPCGHWYCKDCVDGLRQSTSAQDSCPLCREPLPPGPELFYFEAFHRKKKVDRKIERRGRRWANLPPKLQRQMDEVRKLHEQAASQGHAPSHFTLGIMYRDGMGVPRNWTTAKKWMEKAASQGHLVAQYGLACMLSEDGELGQAKARTWLQNAADAGHLDSQNNMGVMLQYGEGGLVDFPRAQELYEVAAARNDADGMRNLGLMYAYGHGMERDLNEAMRWYLKAQAAGYDATDDVAWVLDLRKEQQQAASAAAARWNSANPNGTPESEQPADIHDEIEVPEGHGEGHVLKNISLSDGRSVDITIPVGAKPGMTLTISVALGLVIKISHDPIP